MKKIEYKNIIYQVDAFTNEVFKGNPAAVMIVDQMPSDIYMQNIAMEMNLSETAFVVPQNDFFQIKYFTPTSEIPVAGHPTLASAHILYELGLVPESKEIIFEANVATLKVKKKDDWIVMNLPRFPLKKIEPISEIESILGFQPLEIYESKYDWKIAIAPNVETIKNAKPVFSKMTESKLGHMIITAKSNTSDQDFVVRCFAPALGVNEDPVTGSAHCALTPLWAEKLDKTEMTSFQVSKRTGKLFLKLIESRVEIKGKAVTVFEIKIKETLRTV